MTSLLCSLFGSFLRLLTWFIEPKVILLVAISDLLMFVKIPLRPMLTNPIQVFSLPQGDGSSTSFVPPQSNQVGKAPIQPTKTNPYAKPTPIRYYRCN